MSKGYQSSNLGITQRCADQMVVVGKIEGKRPNFLPLIGLGQQTRKPPPITHHDTGSRSTVCTTLTLTPVRCGHVHQDYIRTKPTYKVREPEDTEDGVVDHSSLVTTPRPWKVSDKGDGRLESLCNTFVVPSLNRILDPVFTYSGCEINSNWTVARSPVRRTP